MYTPEELEIARKIKAEGGSIADAKKAISSTRSIASQTSTPISGGSETLGDIGETISAIKSRFGEAKGFVSDVISQKGVAPATTAMGTLGQSAQATGQIAGEYAGVASDTLFELFTGALKVASPQGLEDATKMAFAKAIAPVANQPSVNRMVQNYEWLRENDPVAYRNARAAIGAGSLLTDIVGFGTLAPGKEVVKGATKEVVKGAGKQLPKVTVPELGGVGSKVNEFVTESIPQATKKVQEYFADAQIRSERIKAADPVVGEAIKNNVPDPIINQYILSEDTNKEAMRSIVESYRAGDQRAITESIASIADEQYKTVETKLADIGQQMNDAIKALPSGTVDMRPAIAGLRSKLEGSGFIFKDGQLVGFGRTGMSTQEEQWVKEMYNKLALYDDNVTWPELKQADSLISRINREAYQSGVRPPVLNNENVSTVVRDVIREELEKQLPGLREINNEYRKNIQFQEALDETLFNIGKTYNIEIDPSMAVQNRLRRVFSNAQSAETYRAITEMLDDFARSQGYEGPSLIDVGEFSMKVQKLYPETIKPGSLGGEIQTGLGGLINTVSNLGTPGIKDTQRALENMVGAGKKAGVVEPQVAPGVVEPKVTPETNITDEMAKKLTDAGIDPEEVKKAIVGGTAGWLLAMYIDDEGSVLPAFGAMLGVATTRAGKLQMLDEALRYNNMRREAFLKAGKTINSPEIKALEKQNTALGKEKAKVADSLSPGLGIKDVSGKAKGVTPPTTLLEEAKMSEE